MLDLLKHFELQWVRNHKFEYTLLFADVLAEVGDILILNEKPHFAARILKKMDPKPAHPNTCYKVEIMGRESSV